MMRIFHVSYRYSLKLSSPKRSKSQLQHSRAGYPKEVRHGVALQEGNAGSSAAAKLDCLSEMAEMKVQRICYDRWD